MTTIRLFKVSLVNFTSWLVLLESVNLSFSLSLTRSFYELLLSHFGWYTRYIDNLSHKAARSVVGCGGRCLRPKLLIKTGKKIHSMFSKQKFEKNKTLEKKRKELFKKNSRDSSETPDTLRREWTADWAIWRLIVNCVESYEVEKNNFFSLFLRIVYIMYRIVLQRSEIKPVVAKESSARFCWRLFGCGSLSWINTPLFFAEISFMCFLRYHCAAATLSTRARRFERFEF